MKKQHLALKAFFLPFTLQQLLAGPADNIQTVENLMGRKQKYLEVTTILVLLR